MIRSFTVSNVVCEGCAGAITDKLGQLGFSDVKVDLDQDPKVVTLDIENEERLNLLKSSLNELNYPIKQEV